MRLRIACGVVLLPDGYETLVAEIRIHTVLARSITEIDL